MNKEESSGEAAVQDAATSDVPPNMSKDSNADIYENRGTKKIIRVVTVMAYLLSVSFVGILLSAYYIFLWEPPNPRLIDRGRLRADPQMQFLIAAAPEMDLDKKKSDLFLESKPNYTFKPLLGRVIPGTQDEDGPDDDPRNNLSIEKQARLNTMLVNLKLSLVEILHAQNRSFLHKSAISDDLFETVEEIINATKRAIATVDREENSISGNGKKIFIEKTQSDSTDPPPEFTDSISMLDIERKSLTSKITTIPETEIDQSHFDAESVTNANRHATPIVDGKKENWNYKREFDAAKTNDDITNGSNRRAFEDNSSEVAQEFPKIDIFDNRKELTKQNKIDGRLTISNNQKNSNDPNNVRTIAASQEHAKNRMNRLSVNTTVNSFRQNYFDNKHPANNQTEEIERDGVSIDSSSRNSEFTHDPRFHQPADNTTIVKSQSYATRNFKETQIERMTARSTTMDNKQIEETGLSTTQRQKGLWEILTETADVEETSVELTSISTARDNQNNFTSIANDTTRASHK